MKESTGKKPRFSVDEILLKIKSPNKELILHARAKWEFMRRNEHFIKDYKILENDKKAIQKDIKQTFINYWGTDPVLDPRRSFEDKVEDFFMFELSRYPDNDEAAYMIACQDAALFVDMLVLPSVYYCSLTFPGFSDSDPENCHSAFFDTGVLDVKVNLNFSKRQLMKDFESLIDLIRPIKESFLPEKQGLKRLRKKHRYDMYPIYWQVFDMKKKGLTYRQIAKEIYPLEEDQLNAETKVKQYYKEAERLIKNVVEF